MQEVTLEKFGNIEKRLSAARGPFRLFGLFLRVDSPERWDLLVAAPWLNKNPEDGLKQVVKEMKGDLNPEEMSSVSRVVVLKTTDEALNSLPESDSLTNTIEDCRFGRVFIRKAHILSRIPF